MKTYDYTDRGPQSQSVISITENSLQHTVQEWGEDLEPGAVRGLTSYGDIKTQNYTQPKHDQEIEGSLGWAANEVQTSK